MKRVVTVAIVLLLCLMVALPVAADVAGANSPEIKIEIKQADMNGLALEDCVEITTVQQAEEKSTDITQEERDALLNVYNALVDGTASLPIEGEYAVREIVDISFKNEACRALEEHGHKDEVLKQPDVVLSIDLDLGIEEGEKICVMTFIDNKWEEIESAENNGDGTITCVFEDLCPVAIAVIG